MRWIENEKGIGGEAVEMERETETERGVPGTGRRIRIEKEREGTKIRIERRRRRIEKGTGRKRENERRGRGKGREKGRRKEKGLGGAAATPGLSVNVRRNCSEKKKENSNQGRADGVFAHTNELTMRKLLLGFTEESAFPQIEFHKVGNAYGAVSVYEVFVLCEDVFALTPYLSSLL